MVKLPDLYSNRVGPTVAPNRAATISQQEASRGSLAWSKTADKVANLADDMRQDFVQARAMELDAELDDELFQIRQKAKESNNPDAIEQEFEARAAAAEKKYLEWLPDRETARRMKGRFDQKIAAYETGVRKSFQNIGDLNFPENEIPQKIIEQNQNLRNLCESGSLSAVECARIEDKYVKDAVKTWSERKALRDPGAHRTFLENYLKAKKSGALDAYSTRTADLTGKLTSGKSRRPAYGWARTNKTWQGLNPYEKAAAMSLMEANAMRIGDAKNVLGAMINRAANEGDDLGAHVSGQIYQPTWEKNQEARLDKILRSKEYKELVVWAQKRAAGEIPDPVNGATHFLAHEKTMLELERQNPKKYRSWRKWTGFNPNTKSYEGVVTRDGSHAFLAPEGKFNGVVGTPGPAGPEDAQNLIPLPPDMVIGHQLLQHLSDVEVQELLDSVKTQQRTKNLEKYSDDTLALEGAIDRIRNGDKLTPENEATIKEIGARWKNLGPQYENKFNGFSNKIKESQLFRQYLNGNDTIKRDVDLDAMSPAEIREHFNTIDKQISKANLKDSAIMGAARDDAFKRAKDLLEKRDTDPFAAVKNIPAVKEMDADLKQLEEQIVKPEGGFDEARLRLLRRQRVEAYLAAQAEVNITNPRHISKDEARLNYRFIKGEGTEQQLYDLAVQHYKKALNQYGDEEIAANIVRDAWELQVKGPNKERLAQFDAGLETARRGTELTKMDVRQLARVARDESRYDPSTAGDRPTRPLPTEAEQKVLRERAGDIEVVNQFRRDYGDEVALNVLYGQKYKPLPKSDDKAVSGPEMGRPPEEDGWTPHGALRDLFSGVFSDGNERMTGEDIAKRRAMSNPYKLPQE